MSVLPSPVLLGQAVARARLRAAGLPILTSEQHDKELALAKYQQEQESVAIFANLEAAATAQRVQARHRACIAAGLL